MTKYFALLAIFVAAFAHAQSSLPIGAGQVGCNPSAYPAPLVGCSSAPSGFTVPAMNIQPEAAGTVLGNFSSSTAAPIALPSDAITPQPQSGAQFMTCTATFNSTATQNTVTFTLSACALNPGRASPTFSAADVGKNIAITGLGSGYTTQYTTITAQSVTSGVETLTLAAANGSNLTNGTVLIAWSNGFDDAAINAAVSQSAVTGGRTALANRVYALGTTGVTIASNSAFDFDTSGAILVCLAPLSNPWTSGGNYAVTVPGVNIGYPYNTLNFTGSYGSFMYGGGILEGMGLCGGIDAEAKGWYYETLSIRDTAASAESIRCAGYCTGDGFAFINVDNDQPGAPANQPLGVLDTPANAFVGNTFTNFPVTCFDNANTFFANSDNHAEHMNVTGCQDYGYWIEPGSAIFHGTDLHVYLVSAASSTQTTTCTSTVNALGTTPVTFQAAPINGATSGTLTAAFPTASGGAGSGYGILFSDGETRAAGIIGSGSTPSISWTGALTGSSFTTSAQISSPVTFSGSLTAGATSGTLTAAAPNGAGNYQFTFSNGQALWGTIGTGSTPTAQWATDPYQGAMFTGSISGTTLTVSSVTGNIYQGQPVAGSGVTNGTTIVSGSGTTWIVNISQTAGSVPMTSGKMHTLTANATAIAMVVQSQVSFTTANCSGSPTFGSVAGNQILVAPALATGVNNETTSILSGAANGGVETLSFGAANSDPPSNFSTLVNQTATLTYGTWPAFFRLDAGANLQGAYVDDLSYLAAGQVGIDITNGKTTVASPIIHSPGTNNATAPIRVGANLDHVTVNTPQCYGGNDLTNASPVPGISELGNIPYTSQIQAGAGCFIATNLPNLGIAYLGDGSSEFADFSGVTGTDPGIAMYSIFPGTLYSNATSNVTYSGVALLKIPAPTCNATTSNGSTLTCSNLYSLQTYGTDAFNAGFFASGAAVTINAGSLAPSGYGSTFGGTAANNFVNLASINTEIGGALWTSVTAPTLTSGWGTGAVFTTAPTGTKLFEITAGTTASTTAVIGLPTAGHFWKCVATDYTTTTDVATPSGNSTTSHTWTWSTAPTSGDKIFVSCEAM